MQLRTENGNGASRGGHTEVVKISDYERVERNYKEAMQPYYTKYSETITPKIYDYVQDNPLVSLLSEKTTFIIYTLMSNTRYTRTPGVTLLCALRRASAYRLIHLNSYTTPVLY